MIFSKNPNRIKNTTSRKVFIVFNTIIILLLTFVFIAPYLNVLAQALNSATDTALGGVGLWPRKWSWSNMSFVLTDPTTWKSFLVTVLRVVIGSLTQLIIIYMAAYALLRKGLRFRKFIVMFLTIPMFINGGIIANYIIYAKLKVYNTFWVYVLPSGFSFFNMVMVRTFLQTIPESLRESARIDGANEFKILWKIMLPLSKPILATVLLWNAVWHWNDWTTTMYYIQNRDLHTLQYTLQLALKKTEELQKRISDAIAAGRPIGEIDANISGESIQAAQIIVSTLPIVMVYPFLQRYFIQGIMIGGVKE